MEKHDHMPNETLQSVSQKPLHHQLSFDLLPLEILIRIFEYLQPIDRIRLERVSKLWRKASQDSWMSIRRLLIVEAGCEHSNFQCRIFLPRDGMKDEEAVIIRRSELFIATDNLKIIQNIVPRVGRLITSLVHDFPDSTKNQRIQSIVSKYCHNIEKLEISNIEDCDKKTFKKLFEVNKKLHSLQVCSSKNVFEAIPTKNWKLLRLSPDVRDTVRCEKKIIAMLNGSSALEEFGSWNSWTPSIMNAVLKHDRLKRLQLLTDPQSPEVVKLLFVVAKLKYLEDLTLSHEELDEHLGVQFYEELSQNCNELQSLEIHCDEMSAGMIDAISTLPKLRKLALRSKNFNDEQLIRLTKFKHLALTFYDDVEDPIHYTERGMLEMIKNADNLERLDFGGFRISWKLLKKVFTEIEKRSKVVRVFISHYLREKAPDYCKDFKKCIVAV